MRSPKSILSIILFSGIVYNFTNIIYSLLLKIELFNLYLNITSNCFVSGLFYGLFLALLIKSVKLGVLVGLFPIALSTSIGGADQAMLSIVVASLLALGFLGAFCAANFLLKLIPKYHFVLDT